MAHRTLKPGNVAKVHRMFERLVRCVARLARTFRQRTQIDRMLEGAGLQICFRRSFRIIDSCVANIAVTGDDLSGIADMLAVMATEAPGKIHMPDIVRMRLPVGLHFGEKVGLI